MTKKYQETLSLTNEGIYPNIKMKQARLETHIKCYNYAQLCECDYFKVKKIEEEIGLFLLESYILFFPILFLLCVFSHIDLIIMCVFILDSTVCGIAKKEPCCLSIMWKRDEKYNNFKNENERAIEIVHTSQKCGIAKKEPCCLSIMWKRDEKYNNFKNENERAIEIVHTSQKCQNTNETSTCILQHLAISTKSKKPSERNINAVLDNESDEIESCDEANARTAKTTNKSSVHMAQEKKKKDDEIALIEDHDAIEKTAVVENGVKNVDVDSKNKDEQVRNDDSNADDMIVASENPELNTIVKADSSKIPESFGKEISEKILPKNKTFSEHNNSVVQDNGSDKGESNDGANASTGQKTDQTSIHTAQESKKRDDEKVLSEDHDASESVIQDNGSDEGESSENPELNTIVKADYSKIPQAQINRFLCVTEKGDVAEGKKEYDEADGQKRDKAKETDNLHQLLSPYLHISTPNVIGVYLVSEPRSETVRQVLLNSLEETRPVMVVRYPWTMMNDEKLRLCTFRTYPRSAPISTILLARNGFVYTGSGSDDKVICFFCEVRHQNWNSHDDARVVHAQLSPACPIVLERDCGNIPISNIYASNNTQDNTQIGNIGSSRDGAANPLANGVHVSSSEQASPRHIVSSGAKKSSNDLEDSTNRGPQRAPRLVGSMSPNTRTRVPSTPNITLEPSPTITRPTNDVLTAHQNEISVAETGAATSPEPLISTDNRSPTESSSLFLTETTNQQSQLTQSMAQYNQQANVSQTNQETTRISRPSNQPTVGITRPSPQSTSRHNPPSTETISATQTTSTLPQSNQSTLNTIETSQSMSSNAHSNQSAGSSQPSNHSTSNTHMLNQSTSSESRANQSASSMHPTNQPSQPASNNGSSNTTTDPSSFSPGRLGIITDQPKRPEFASLPSRLASFNGWPSNHIFSGDELAKAGFYFAGYGDCVRCFYCHGGLRNWQDGDNMWVEHARWFSKCAFLQQTVGHNFIDAVQQLSQTYRENIPFEQVLFTIGSNAASFHSDVVMSRPNPEKDPAVRSVVALGYDERRVVRAARKLIDEERTLNAETLFAKVTGIELSNVSMTPEDAAAFEKKRNENQELRQIFICKICLDRPSSILFLPCGHLVSCHECSMALRNCPLCRVSIRGRVRTLIE